MANVVSQITITMEDQGAFKVEGSIENKLIAYGMLEIAREVVKQYHDEAAKRIQAPTAAERLALSLVKP